MEDYQESVYLENQVEGENMEQEERTINGSEEMSANDAMDTNIPEDEKAKAKSGKGKKKDDRVWHNKEGLEVSMSEFIREKFQEDEMTKKEISDEYEINYRTVYGACLNLTNSRDKGTSKAGTTVLVSAEGQLCTAKKDGDVTHYFLDNEEIDENRATEVSATATNVDRETFIKNKFDEGESRGNIAKLLDVSYGVVYQSTKGETSGNGRHVMVTVEKDGQEVEMPRVDYIREEIAKGRTKKELAEELHVAYNVVWQATKKEKTEAEKYAEAIKKIGKFHFYAEQETEVAELCKKLSDMQVLELDEVTKAPADANAAEAATEPNSEA